MDKKYEALTERLNREPLDLAEITMTFQEVERVCRVRLPKTAADADFWENPTNRPYFRGIKKAIKAAGFSATLVGDAKVRFRRT